MVDMNRMQVIYINSASYTAWEIRWRCLEALPDLFLQKEAVFLDEMLDMNPKNYQLWNYRRRFALKRGKLFEEEVRVQMNNGSSALPAPVQIVYFLSMGRGKGGSRSDLDACELWEHRHASATSFFHTPEALMNKPGRKLLTAVGACAARSSCTQAGAWLTTPRTTTPGHTGAPSQRHLVPGSASCQSSPRC